MLEAIRTLTKGWIAKVILAIITVPFALFGIDSYFNNAGGNVAVAKMDGDKISVQEYSNAMERVRNQLLSSGEKIDSNLLESPEFKQSILDGLISRRLVNEDIVRHRFNVSDHALNQHILNMPEFQENGKFSEDLYHKTLQQNRLTPAKFENSIRADMTANQAKDGLATLAFAPIAAANQALKSTYERREVSTLELSAQEFFADASVTDQAVKDYYETHKDKFQAPEQVKLEFALLSAAGLIGQVSVSDEEVRNFFESNREQFEGDEQRQASHILISLGETDAEKTAAKEKAEGILAQLRIDPSQFEQLAVKHSQDGSAENGGDLGSFSRGTMVKPFEDAVYAMNVGDISNLVETEFGFHIIKLTNISGSAPTFEDVKPQLKADLLFQQAQLKYAENTEEFANIVYEQSGSLKPVAEKFDLQLQTTQWMSKEDVGKFFKNDKIMAMVFSDDVLKDKRNSEAIEVSPDNLVAARVVDYKASAPRTFDEVKEAIASALKLEQAMKKVTEHGEGILAKLKAGETTEELDWVSSVIVDRKNAQGLSNSVMENVFKVNTDKLPAYDGFVEDNKGYVIMQVLNTTNPLAADESSKLAAQQEFEAVLGQEYVSAYNASLVSNANVEVNSQVLFGDGQPQ